MSDDLFMVSKDFEYIKSWWKIALGMIEEDKLLSAKEKIEKCLENVKNTIGTIPYIKFENARVDENDPTIIHVDVIAPLDLMEFMQNPYIKFVETDKGYTLVWRMDDKDK